jgi:ketosteroid isomerase-like protein
MGRRRRTHTPSSSFCMAVLCFVVTLFLQSCKIDKAPAPAQDDQAGSRDRPRAVFGEKVMADQPRAQAATTSRPAGTRGRTAQVQPERLARQQQSGAITQRSESVTIRAREESLVRKSDSVARRDERGEQDSGLFLYYQRPGTRLGDPGELGSRGQNSSLPQPDSVAGHVYRWADTLLSRNLDAHMKLYAPVLERFGEETNVGRDLVRREKERFLTKLAPIRRFEIHDLRIREDNNGQLATAEFRADWNADTAGAVTHSARHRLTFRRSSREWQIQSEEQFWLDSRLRTTETSKR